MFSRTSSLFHLGDRGPTTASTSSRAPLGSFVVLVGLALLLGVPTVSGAATVAELEETYRRSLLELSSGLDAALAAVADVQSGAYSDDDPLGSLGRLEKAQRRVINRLTGERRDSLVLLAFLHGEAYLEHQRRKEPRVAVHSRELAIDLIHRFDAKKKDDSTREITVDLLTRLGVHALEVRAPAGASRLFRLALDLEPTYAPPYLGLGVCAEKTGDYERAVLALFDLLRRDPNADEGALRLAVNLTRVDRAPEAVQFFSRVIASENAADWVRILAYQELARTLVDQEQMSRARDVVEAGLGRYPESQDLRLQAALLNERLRAQDRARDWIEGVSPLLQTRTYRAPRDLYNLYPTEKLYAESKWIRLWIEERLENLARPFSREAGP